MVKYEKETKLIPIAAKKLIDSNSVEAVEALLWECVYAEAIRFDDAGNPYYYNSGDALQEGVELVWE